MRRDTIIIGEKINGAIPGVKRAIESKDEEYIRSLAILQTEAGTEYLDICASTEPQLEEEALLWLMAVVQEAVDKPLRIDSPNPGIFELQRMAQYL